MHFESNTKYRSPLQLLLRLLAPALTILALLLLVKPVGAEPAPVQAAGPEKKREKAEPADQLEFKESQKQVKASLEERLEILEEEIERIKLKKATRKEYKSKDGMGPAASEVYWSAEGLTWGGYGEGKFKHYKKSRRSSSLGCLAFLDNIDERESCFSDYRKNRGKPVDQADLHRFILYAGYRFNEWIVLNAEIEYEHAGFEDKSPVDQPEVYVEFAYLDFKLHDALQIGVGLQLLPVGITNLLHEPTTFMAVERPLTETNLIPTTWREMGVLVHGNAKDLLVYRAGVFTGGRASQSSDSSWIRGSRQKGSKASMDGLAGVLGLDVKPLEGLALGTSYYQGMHGQNELLEIGPATRLKILDSSDPRSKIVLADKVTLEEALQDDISDFAPVRVHIAEGHIVFNQGPFSLKALAARGWMNEADTRAVNRNTGKNVGMEVEGGYMELGFDVLSLTDSSQKLVLFVRPERINTQRRTARYNTTDNAIDYICKENNYTNCRKFDDLSSGKSVGVIQSKIEKAVNAELKKNGSSYRMGGAPDPVNDRTILTAGVAYFPHPNVVLKLDYESHQSASEYHKDIEQRNSGNNKIDRVNFAAGFIF